MKIGRYDIEGEIASGGMGVVHMGVDPHMKRKVAVKLLKREYSRNREIRTRFEREAEAVAALEHPHIAPVYDFGEHEGQLYCVMRYLPGGTLRHRIEEGKVPVRELAPVIQRVAEALDAAHERGIIHRDIKPANILFDDQGKAFLSDFGIAKVERAQDLTHTSVVVGTPLYMSPEQAQGQELDGRADVYALGGVAFHAMAGEPPFRRATPLATAMAQVADPIPSLCDEVEGLPAVADRIFRRALAKKAAQRYATAGELARDLGDVASGRWYLVKLSS